MTFSRPERGWSEKLPPRMISSGCCSCSRTCCGGWCVVISGATTTTTGCRAAASRGWATGVTPATPIIRGVTATTRRRGASTIAPVSVSAIRIAVLVTIATVTTTTIITIPTRRVVRVTMITWIASGATVPHVFTRSRCMWAVSHGIVHTDTTTIEILLVNGKKGAVGKRVWWALKIVRLTMPFNSWMHRVASSTVAILMKPNPRERSDC